MKLEEVEKWNHKYKEPCDCGRINTLYTQEDDKPEYYTDVYLECICGNFIHFRLPVN